MSASLAPWTTAGLSIAAEGLTRLESIVRDELRVGGRFRLHHVEVRLVFGAFRAFQLLGADEVEGPVPGGDAGAVGEGHRAAFAVAGGRVPAGGAPGGVQLSSLLGVPLLSTEISRGAEAVPLAAMSTS